MDVPFPGIKVGSAGASLRGRASLHAATAAGETLGVVGESGSGKSTLGWPLLAVQPHEGSPVAVGWRSASTRPSASLALVRRRMQVVFQDPLRRCRRA